MRSVFSSNWHRVADLQPRLRSHARIIRQMYRGQIWYVLEDPANQRFHRFTRAAHLVIGSMNGQHTVQELWEMTCERLGDDAPTQDEMIHLLGQLHATDVLQCDVPPDAAELLERRERQQRRKWQQQVFNVFAWRVRLVDPERFLTAAIPFVAPLMGWAGAALWLAVVIPAVALVAMHWTELTHDLVARVLLPQNVFTVWLIFPVVKTLHELGHAFTTKKFGGEVHDMGVMLLVVTPVPYVDASAAWAFRSKWHRALVGCGGMIVELFIAALAVYIWTAAEPGVVRLVTQNAIMIAGISTVLFNANPLLRYDGYHILVDLIEMPNLRQRANAYLMYLCERYPFGRTEAEEPIATRGERIAFVIYAIAAFLYRILVVVGIMLFIGDRFFWLAAFFATFCLIAWIGVPAFKGARFLASSPRIRKVRGRAIVATAAAIAVVVAICVTPLPYRSLIEGVVWLPEESYVRAAAAGFVQRVAVEPGAHVRRGDVLIVMSDEEIVAQVAQLEARRREIEARYAEQRPSDPVKAAIILEDLRSAERDLARARQRAGDLLVRALVDGTFVAPTMPDDLAGRFAKKGELLGYVVDPATVTVRAVVPQGTIDLVREQTAAIDVRLAEQLERPLPALVRRITPGASERLPSSALGSEGGGAIAVDPRDQRGMTAVQKVFQIDLELPATSGRVNSGGRAYVRFSHGRAPLAAQWYQSIRRLFLSRFNA